MADIYTEFASAVEAYERAVALSKTAEARAVAERHRAMKEGDRDQYNRAFEAYQYNKALEAFMHLADEANSIHPRKVFRGRAEMFEMALEYFAGPAIEDQNRVRPGLASFILGEQPKDGADA